MTISANSTLDFQRDEIITMAYQLAGFILPAPSADDVEMASNFMNLELMMLQAEGVVLRSVSRTTLTLTSGTASYSLPTGVIDIEIGPNGQAGTIVPTSGGESIVTLMTRAEYLDISNKATTTTGRPSRVYLEKASTLAAVFWPTPDTSSTSFRYAKVSLLADADDGGVTLDLARRWLKAVTYAVASEVCLAKSGPLDKVGFLRGECERMKEILRADDSERAPIRLVAAQSGRRW